MGGISETTGIGDTDMFRFWPKAAKPKDASEFDGVDIIGAGVVRVDLAKLIEHPNFKRQMEAVRRSNAGTPKAKIGPARDGKEAE